MKILIASDLHGSSLCIEKLNKRINAENVEKVLLLGDLLYHGPRNSLPDEYDTQKSAELLNKNVDKIICVRGNCDAEVDQALLDFSIESPHLIMDVDGMTIFATHGHYYNTSHLPSISSFDIILHGHTHIPTCEKIDGCDNKFYINPGSVSIPKGNSINSYIIYENKVFLWKDLDGNIYKEFKL